MATPANPLQDEFSIRGPFGGIQSQMSPDDIEDVGFLDVNNVIFRDGLAFARPGLTPQPDLPAPTNENVGCFADFFNAQAARVQTVITPTRLILWSNGAYSALTGPTLNGLTTSLYSTAIVNYKLAFSQGIDPVMLFDGISSSYAVASGSAVAARFLMELSTHLILGYTNESSVSFPQRIRWTGAGDPTDFTSFNAGLNDLVNDLGPITSLAKLYQTGYALQQEGITQIIPTGVGTAPFAFVPLSSRAHGCIAPYSSAIYGESLVFYVGKDNVYMFDGTQSHPIGDMPWQGRKRIGARSRILADLASSNLQAVVGTITTGVNGNDFNAYLLSIPGIALWVYNIDEQNWTRLTFANTILTMNRFFVQSVPRIIDLRGTIAQQQWSPATLIATSPFDALGFSFVSGGTSIMDFTNYSELPWSITSGQHTFKDNRRQKTVKKFRLSVLDNGPVTYTITVTGLLNNPNTPGFNTQSMTKSITIGFGSGLVLKKYIDFSVPGDYIKWQVSGPAFSPAAMVEFAPIYDIGGENRNW